MSSLVFLIIPLINAQSGYMKLLAVSGEGEGSVADLYLDIEPGKGKVYIETFPVTQMDTQLSTRFAKQVACKFLNADCSKYNFYYTIKSAGSIIGGPSAGAALAMLTAAMLDGQPYNENVTVTGTINSGGIIGTVGGIKEKIEAAALQNISKVLVPKGTRNFLALNRTKLNETIIDIDNDVVWDIEQTNDSIIIVEIDKSANKTANKTITDSIDMVDFGRGLGVDVIEVLTLADALSEFTEKDYSKNDAVNGTLDVSYFYEQTMNAIADDLCRRAVGMKERIKSYYSFNATYFKEGMDLLNKSAEAVADKKFYAAASFCFTANINFDYLLLQEDRWTTDSRREKINQLVQAINASNAELDEKELKTLVDLQVYMIVKERLIDALDHADKANKYIELTSLEDVMEPAENVRKPVENAGADSVGNSKEKIDYEIAYATERLHSADSWEYFFGKGEVLFAINKEFLKKSCEVKLSEAQERIQYFHIIYSYPLLLESTEKELERGFQQYEAGDYNMCLMHAMNAKAEIDAILSTASLKEEHHEDLLDAKLELAKQIILEQQRKGNFPIMGYSYYEYASKLRETGVLAALVYAENALEISNLELYFERLGEKKTLKVAFKEFAARHYEFFAGLGAGFLMAAIFIAIMILCCRRYDRRCRICKPFFNTAETATPKITRPVVSKNKLKKNPKNLLKP